MKPLPTNPGKKRGRKPKAENGNHTKTTVSRKNAAPLKAKEIKKQLEDVATTTAKQLVHHTSSTLINAVKTSVKKPADETTHLLETSLTSICMSSPKRSYNRKSGSTLGGAIRSSSRRPKPIKSLKMSAVQNGTKEERTNVHKVLNGDNLTVKIQRIKSAVNVMTNNGHTRLNHSGDDTMGNDVNMDAVNDKQHGTIIKCDPIDSAVEVGKDALEFQANGNGRAELPNTTNGNDGMLKRTLSKIVRSASKTSIKFEDAGIGAKFNGNGATHEAKCEPLGHSVAAQPSMCIIS